MKSYMVVVRVSIRPQVYVEVLAKNADEAVASVKAKAVQIVADNLEAYVSEARIELSEVSDMFIAVLSAGRSSQYHSDAECEICANENKKAKKATPGKEKSKI